MKALPAELEAKIDEIYSWMLDKDINKVAKISGRHRNWVSRVLRKKVAPDMKVIEAGIEVMNQTKARLEINSNMKIAS
jgi:hypothetical protein